MDPIPVTRAREVRQILGLKEYPVRAAQVVEDLEISLKEIDIDESEFDGCALKEDGVMGILVNSRVPYPSRRNFTIAHELGHCRIETHLDPEYRCTHRSINSFDPRSRTETEASEFAAELLMPEIDFDRLAGRVPPSIMGLKELAKRFGTSLTATSIRYVGLSPDPCVVAMSSQGGILWAVKSRSFPFEIRQGPLSDNSYAADYFRGTRLPQTGQPVLRSAWARDGKDRPDISLVEEAQQFGGLGLVLSLLIVADSYNDDEENNDGGRYDG